MNTTDTHTPTAADLYVDPYPGRKGSERIVEDCYCDNGAYTGFTYITDHDGFPYHFECKGTGKISFLVSSARAKARRDAKRRAERLAVPALRAEWEEDHPEAAAAIKTYRDRSDFIYELDERLGQYGALTEKQESAVLRTAERIAAQDAEPKVEVPASRHTVDGVIVSAQLRRGYMDRSQWKILVKSDDGFKVWGTAPATIVEAAHDAAYFHHDNAPTSDVLKGARVRFVATLEPKPGEAGFGFFQRASKAEITFPTADTDN